MNPQEEYDNLDQDYINIQEADWREIASAEPEQIILEEDKAAFDKTTLEDEDLKNSEKETLMAEAVAAKKAQTPSEGDIVSELVSKIDTMEASPISVDNILLQIEAAAEAESITLHDDETVEIADQVIATYKQKMQGAKLEQLQNGETIAIDLNSLIQDALSDFVPTQPIESAVQEEDLEDIIDELKEKEKALEEQPTLDAKKVLLEDIIEELAEDKEVDAEKVMEAEEVEDYLDNVQLQNEEEEEEKS